MKIAVYPVSKLYYESVLPSVKSLLINSDVETVYLTIEDSKFPAGLPECVKTLNAKTLKKKYLKGVNVKKSPYAYLSLLRCAYPKIFEESRILALDADTIVRENIGSEPWEMDMQGAYIAGVAEFKLSRQKRRNYINAGMLVYDCDAIRRDGKDEELLSEINETDYYWLEQDCINEVFKKQILVLPKIWNASQFTGVSKKTLIRHYAQEKDWKETEEYKKYYEMTWDEVLERRVANGHNHSDQTEA